MKATLAHSPRSRRAKRLLPTFAALAVLFFSVSAFAHELRPAYLELREEKPGEFSVLWKTPMLGDARLALEPEFSGDAKAITPVTTRTPPGAAIQQWTLRASTLRGQTLHIRGLEATMTDALVQIEFADGTAWTQRLTAAATSSGDPDAAKVFGPWSASISSSASSTFCLGVDHLLFVLALIIITGGGWMLVKTVTAFTVSHSITLTAATLGFVHVPQAPVEAVIALSIVFVACGDRPSSPGPFGIDRALAVDCGAHLRAAARAWLCGSAERRRVAAGTHSAGAAVL